MPLIQSKTNAARSKNIAELVKSGYKTNQAAAIAYSEQRQPVGKPKAPKKKGVK